MKLFYGRKNYSSFTARMIPPYSKNKIKDLLSFQLRISLMLCCIALPYATRSQQVTTIQAGHENDSSYYHLTKISDNEYWACGENGIITSFDTLGRFNSLPIPTEGYNLLKAERWGDYVFIATDNGRILRYNLKSKVLFSQDYPKYLNRCFYDFLILSNGQILLCGGTTGISKGLKKIPHGFIAVTDTSLKKISRVWRSYRKFVWSLSRKKDGPILAAVFNGFNSKIIQSKDTHHWKLEHKIKGLVHEIKLTDTVESVTYVGTAGIHYGKKGIYNLDGLHHQIINGSGCFWSQETFSTYRALCNQNGKLHLFNHTSPLSEIQVSPSFALYDLKFFNSRKILIVGHGKCAYIIDF